MKYVNRKKIRKVTVLLGIGLIICQGIFFIGAKNAKIKKLKEEAEEEIKKDEFDEAIKIYEKVEEKGEKIKEIKVLEIYMESREHFKEGNFKLAELKINSINEAVLNKVLREKINLLQEEISLEISFNMKITEIKRLSVENEYLKGMEVLRNMKEKELDKKNVEQINKVELELKESQKEYKENIRKNFINDMITLEKAELDYKEWENLLKKVLSKLQKNLNEEEIEILREEYGKWRGGMKKLSKNRKNEEIKSYIQSLIQKF